MSDRETQIFDKKYLFIEDGSETISSEAVLTKGVRILSAIVGVTLILMSIYFFTVLDFQRGNPAGLKILVAERFSSIMIGLFALIISLRSFVRIQRVALAALVVGLYTSVVAAIGSYFYLIGDTDVSQYVHAHTGLETWLFDLGCGTLLMISGLLGLWSMHNEQDE